jgi:DNA modification methylase
MDASGTAWLKYIPRFKPKDMVPTPWMLAMALQADGWYLRSDIIWSKSNPMPESVTDRPTKAHEYVFLLSKQPRYFFDQEAVREMYAPASEDRYRYAFGGSKNEDLRKQDAEGPGGNRTVPIGMREFKGPSGPDGRKQTNVQGADGSIQHRDGERWPNGGRNVRSVWEIATQPSPEKHFATYPEGLVRRCLLAGCPEGGTVLDPFIGSGTTALVARKHGRKCVGVELSPVYAELCARRLSQLSLLAEEPVA